MNTRQAAPQPATRPREPVAAKATPPSLQQRLGNRQLLGLLQEHALQAKLTISAPGDALETEADAVAERVMRMPLPALQAGQTSHPLVQRKCRKCEDELHRHALGTAPDLHDASALPSLEGSLATLQGRGSVLPDTVRSFMEPRFNADFSAVRIHTDGHAQALARSVSAKAFTVGRDVVFGAGEFAPATEGGLRLIAHELTHVIQQGERTTAPATLARDTQRRDQTRIQSIPPQLTLEKTSAQLEAAYRNTGDLRRADAIRRCRLSGGADSQGMLTEQEAMAAYALAKEGYGPNEAATLVSRQADGATLPWVAPAVAALTAQLTGVGTYVLAALPPVAIAAVAALFLVALVEAVRFARFVSLLEAHGFVVLLNPLAACISGLCHQPGGARSRPLPFPDFEPLTPAGPGRFGPFGPNPFGRATPEQMTPLEPWIEPVPRPLPGPPTAPSLPRPRIETATKRRPGRGRERERETTAEPIPFDPGRNRRDDCRAHNPTAMTCTDTGPEEVRLRNAVLEFIEPRGYGPESYQGCKPHRYFLPGQEITACDHAAGHTKHCEIRAHFDPTKRVTHPAFTLSLFACVCCDAEGESGFNFTGAHGSPGDMKR
jgi:hypothetical protein